MKLEPEIIVEVLYREVVRLREQVERLTLQVELNTMMSKSKDKKPDPQKRV